MKSTGTILILLGLGLTIFTGFKFFTKEKVVDLGAVEIVRDKPDHLHWPPALGIFIMGIGSVVLWRASKK